jgi:long-chain acyl-CoA synthetase
MDAHYRAAEHEVGRSPLEVDLDPSPGPSGTSLDLDLDLESRAGVRPTARPCDLVSLLARQARQAGERPAVVGPETVTWAGAAARVEQAAGALAAHGVGLDAGVVVAADAPAARLVGFLAVAHLGGVAVPSAPASLADRPTHLGAPAAAVITDAADLVSPVAGDVPVVVLHRDGRPVAPSGAAVTPALRPSARSARPLVAHATASAALDGPTVARRHRHLVAEAVAVARALRLDADDAVLSPAGLDTPLGLAFGVLVPLATCAALLDPMTVEPATATVVAAGPAWFAELAAGGLLEGALDRVRWCLTDDAVPREVARAMTARHGVTVRRTYGRPDSGLVMADLGTRSFHDPSAVGVGLPGVEVRLVDGDGRECEPGAIGELALRCPWTAEPADIADGFGGDARLADGRLLTGDQGCLDDAGDLVLIAGRGALRDRHAVGPDVVSEVLADHPAVAEVVVTTVTGPGGVRLLKAVVVVGERCDRRELLAWCRRHLPEPAVPALIEFRRELPGRVAPVPSEVGAADAPVPGPAALEVVPLVGPPAPPAVGHPSDPLAARLTG